MILAAVVSASLASTFSFDPRLGIERVWVGPDFFQNNLQDWSLKSGQIRCVESRLPARTLQCLTARIGDGTGTVNLKVTTGQYREGESLRGFLIGSGSEEIDYRLTALVHQSPGKDGGVMAVVDENGQATFRDFTQGRGGNGWTMRAQLEEGDIPELEGVKKSGEGSEGPLRMSLQITPAETGYLAQLRVRPLGSEVTVSEATVMLTKDQVEGSFALFSHKGAGGNWFDGIEATGTKLDLYPERSFGPFASPYYTVSRGVLKMTVQGMPLSDDEPGTAVLQFKRGDRWETVDQAGLDFDAKTYRFRVENYEAVRDQEYRVCGPVHNGREMTEACTFGTIRKEPKRDDLTAAVLTCMKSWTGGNEWNHGSVWFPHNKILEGIKAAKPDILLFTGDQIYEGDLTPARRQPAENIYLDYLSKYYRFCWSMGDVLRKYPSVIIPDDHDVYQGNLWGNGGRRGVKQGDITAQDIGYTTPAWFINAVHKSQTSHLPDPFDDSPVGELELSAYTTSVDYGGVSFAVLADRQFKSSPALDVPEAKFRNGFPLAEGFDPTKTDNPRSQLLGQMQERFLEQWSEDWGTDTEFKAVVSQTILNCLQVKPIGDKRGNEVFNMPYPDDPHDIPEGMEFAADADSNGWPQSGRNRAVRLMRKAFAVHFAGDQHLASIIQYGVDSPRDGNFAFCVPSMANTWPRRWYPPVPGLNRAEGSAPYTGDFKDGFGNLVTVWAVANPYKTKQWPEQLNNRVPGWGVAKFNKATREITMECWPRWVDSSKPDAQQYRDWPIVIPQRDNYKFEPAGFLPEVSIALKNSVVQLVDEFTGEKVYTLRIRGHKFTAPVPTPGEYSLRIQLEDGSWRQIVKQKIGSK